MAIFFDMLQQIVTVILLGILFALIGALLYNFYCFFVDVTKSPEQRKKEGKCSCGSCWVSHLPKNPEDGFELGLVCSWCGTSLYVYDLVEDEYRPDLDVKPLIRGKI